MSETWRPISGFEGIYEISDAGRVRSLDRKVWSSRGRGFWRTAEGCILKPGALPTGHLHICLKWGGRRSNRQIHRLVLEAFVGPCPKGMEGCHNDGDPTNNALSNLRWDSRSANQRDAVRHGTHVSARKTHCSKGHPFSPENTRWDGRSRRCRACNREHSRNAYERLIGKAQQISGAA